MTAKSKTPRRRASLAREFPMTKVRKFFSENPHEIQTLPDLCVKFDLTKAQDLNILRTLNSEGVAHRRTMVCGKEAC